MRRFSAKQELVPSQGLTDRGDCHDQGLLFRSGQFFPVLSLCHWYLLFSTCSETAADAENLKCSP